MPSNQHNEFIEKPLEELLKECDLEIESPRAAFDIVIPGEIRINPNLSWQEKHLYGLIRNLCRREGYCWATNNYLAKEMDVCERHVKRYIDNLVQEGAITRQIFHNKMIKRRRIWISGAFETFKKSLVRTFMSSPSGHSCHLREDIHVLYTEERVNKERKEDVPPPKIGTSTVPPIAQEMNEYLFQKILNLTPNAKPYNQRSWSQTFDRINRIDKRSWEEIKEMIDWAHDTSEFWCKNILSPEALRKHWDKMQAQRAKGNNQPSFKKTNIGIAREAQSQLRNFGSTKSKEFFINDTHLVRLDTGERIELSLSPEDFENKMIDIFKLRKS